MKFLKKRKIKKIRAEIVDDDDLLPEQKETALARLQQKEIELFQPDNIARQSQSIFQTLLPSIVGKVQLKRLETRNDMIREMRTTLNELAETKKAWERLKNIDAEIAVEQALAYQQQMETEAKHDKNMAEFRLGKKEIEQRSERADLQHSVDTLKLKMELETLRREQAEGPPKKKTLTERIQQIEDQITLDKKEVIGALLLKQLQRDFEQGAGQKENETINLERYERLRRQMKTLKEQGFDEDAIRQINAVIDHEFGFDRDEED